MPTRLLQAQLLLTRMSTHRDLQADSRASIVVAREGFSNMNQARCTITGRITTLEDDAERAAAREDYLARHPEAFWVDFGDFSFMQMREITAVGYVGGFGGIHKVWLCIRLVQGPF